MPNSLHTLDDIRYVPHSNLPAEAFLPGTETPRPEETEYGEGPWSSDRWWEVEPWLMGVDLFNRGFFWEAHEAWEAVWLSWPRESEKALFVRGMIQIAAALLKLRLEVQGGVEKLSVRSLKTLEQANRSVVLGMETGPVVGELRRFWRSPELSLFPRLWPGQQTLRALHKTPQVDIFLAAFDRSLNSNTLLLHSEDLSKDGVWQILAADRLRDWHNFHAHNGTRYVPMQEDVLRLKEPKLEGRVSWGQFLEQCRELLVNGPSFHPGTAYTDQQASSIVNAVEPYLRPGAGGKVEQVDPNSFQDDRYFCHWGWDRCWRWKVGRGYCWLLMNGGP